MEVFHSSVGEGTGRRGLGWSKELPKGRSASVTLASDSDLETVTSLLKLVSASYSSQHKPLVLVYGLKRLREEPATISEEVMSRFGCKNLAAMKDTSPKLVP